MKRIYAEVARHHLDKNQLLFLTGPGRVGKNHLGIEHTNLNWDKLEDRALILQGPAAVACSLTHPGTVFFDELEKYREWKSFLQEFMHQHAKIKTVITGRTAEIREGFVYRIHPLSVAEILNPHLRSTKIAPPKRIETDTFNELFTFGGFPEPFLNKSRSFHSQWKKSTLRKLTADLAYAEILLLAEILKKQTGQALHYTSLAKMVNVSLDTVKRWIERLKASFYCYTIRPWTQNIPRTILKEPKLYLWDWSLIGDKDARKENFIASHLLKMVHFWVDRGYGTYELYYVRDKEKKGVNFLVTKDNRPWFLVDLYRSNKLSKSLCHFQEVLEAEFAFQVCFEKEYTEGNCFESARPQIVSPQTFLSQLV